MKIRTLVPIVISAILPGLGQVAAGRAGRGLLLFFLFGFAVDGLLYSQAQSILPAGHARVSPGTIRTLALIAGGLVWLVAVADTIVLARRRRRIEAKTDEATAHIRSALIAYLRSDYRAATRAIRAALRINAQDPDALFHLGVILAAAGEHRKARRAFRRCIQLDDEGKWDAKVADHLRTLDAAPPSQPPATPKSPKDEHGEAQD